jgi:drug/metabolite transporter (DMT)-like permease
LSNRWAATAETGAVPVFLLSTGLVVLALRFPLGERSVWSARALAETLYMAVGPSLLAYAFWDRAMRRGHLVLVASLSYLTPVLSTAASCLYLAVEPRRTLWIACGLVVGGALLSKISIRDAAPPAPDAGRQPAAPPPGPH